MRHLIILTDDFPGGEPANKNFFEGKFKYFFDSLDTTQEARKERRKLTRKYINEIETNSQLKNKGRLIFARNMVEPLELEKELEDLKKLICTPKELEIFVCETLRKIMGVLVQPHPLADGYTLTKTVKTPLDINFIFEELALGKNICFVLPAPKGFTHIGDRHPLVSYLCVTIIDWTLQRGKEPARAAVVKTKGVREKTTIIIFLSRHTILDKKLDQEDFFEKVVTWGYRGSAKNLHCRTEGVKDRILNQEEIQRLLSIKVSPSNISTEEKESILATAIEELDGLEGMLNEVSQEYAREMTEIQNRYGWEKEDAGRYKVVDTVLPLDYIGVYILLPDDFSPAPKNQKVCGSEK